ncbi:MAG TPA: hypothetical protein PKE63_12770 [Lacibacter sp.]|nr:hypothetical protein [Lacibacter sp.]
MRERDNLGTFFKETKDLLQDYLETRLEIFRLQGIRVASRTIGFLAWLFLSVFLFVLVLIFIGLVLGFWFSSLTGSYVMGFGIATLILVLLIVLLTIFRKALFVNPVIRTFIRLSSEPEPEEEESER